MADAEAPVVVTNATIKQLIIDSSMRSAYRDYCAKLTNANEVLSFDKFQVQLGPAVLARMKKATSNYNAALLGQPASPEVAAAATTSIATTSKVDEEAGSVEAVPRIFNRGADVRSRSKQETAIKKSASQFYDAFQDLVADRDAASSCEEYSALIAKRADQVFIQLTSMKVVTPAMYQFFNAVRGVLIENQRIKAVRTAKEQPSRRRVLNTWKMQPLVTALHTFITNITFVEKGAAAPTYDGYEVARDLGKRLYYDFMPYPIGVLDAFLSDMMQKIGAPAAGGGDAEPPSAPSRKDEPELPENTTMFAMVQAELDKLHLTDKTPEMRAAELVQRVASASRNKPLKHQQLRALSMINEALQTALAQQMTSQQQQQQSKGPATVTPAFFTLVKDHLTAMVATEKTAKKLIMLAPMSVPQIASQAWCCMNAMERDRVLTNYFVIDSDAKKKKLRTVNEVSFRYMPDEHRLVVKQTNSAIAMGAAQVHQIGCHQVRLLPIDTLLPNDGLSVTRAVVGNGCPRCVGCGTCGGCTKNCPPRICAVNPTLHHCHHSPADAAASVNGTVDCPHCGGCKKACPFKNCALFPFMHHCHHADKSASVAFCYGAGGCTRSCPLRTCRFNGTPHHCHFTGMSTNSNTNGNVENCYGAGGCTRACPLRICRFNMFPHHCHLAPKAQAPKEEEEVDDEYDHDNDESPDYERVPPLVLLPPDAAVPDFVQLTTAAAVPDLVLLKPAATAAAKLTVASSLSSSKASGMPDLITINASMTEQIVSAKHMVDYLKDTSSMTSQLTAVLRDAIETKRLGDKFCVLLPHQVLSGESFADSTALMMQLTDIARQEGVTNLADFAVLAKSSLHTLSGMTLGVDETWPGSASAIRALFSSMVIIDLEACNPKNWDKLIEHAARHTPPDLYAVATLGGHRLRLGKESHRGKRFYSFTTEPSVFTTGSEEAKHTKASTASVDLSVKANTRQTTNGIVVVISDFLCSQPYDVYQAIMTMPPSLMSPRTRGASRRSIKSEFPNK